IIYAINYVLYTFPTRRSSDLNIEDLYSIKFNNFKINFHKGVSKFEIYDTIETEHKFKIFSDFYLPISIIKTTNKEVEEIRKMYEDRKSTRMNSSNVSISYAVF